MHNSRRMVCSTARICLACMGQCHRNPLYKASELLRTSLLRTSLLGTWVNKARETLLNRRLCPAEAAHAKAQTRSSSGTRRDREVFGHGIFVAGLVRRGVRAVADGVRTLPPMAGGRPLAADVRSAQASPMMRTTLS